MRQHEHHDGALADAIWWLKGFAAAQQPDPFDGPNDAAEMSASLRETRLWLRAVASCNRRVLGLTDRALAMIVTEAEFEQMLDGLQHNTDGDREAGLATARRILDEFRAEQQRDASNKPAF